LVFEVLFAFKKRYETTFWFCCDYWLGIMSAYVNQRVKKIPWGKRNKADTKKISTPQMAIRSRSMDATMSMLRKMSVIAEPDTYQSVARGMMLIANSTPIKCICVGISPYENGILPAFATALAYSPRTCIGVTPSVQVMSQIMSLCAIEVKDRYANKTGDTNPEGYVSRDEYTRRFAMMLRCSYACLEAGVAFVNSSPVVTNAVSKTCMSKSLFSEWLANIIMIHSEFNYKLWVVSMGASADEVVSSATSSYPDLSSNMRLIRSMNPAALSRMSVKKFEMMSPISDMPTTAEMLIDSIVGASSHMDPKAGFSWNRYEDSTLKKFLGTDPVKSIVLRLADHVPDQLINQCATSIQSLYIIMSDYDLEAMIESTGVSQEAIANAGGGYGTNDYSNQIHEATSSQQTNQQPNVMINPFDQAHQERDSGMGQNSGQNSSGNFGGGYNSNQGYNQNQGGDQSKSDGPYKFPARSQLGQLLDPTGKGVSQQVIVIDSFHTSCERLMTAHKQTQMDMKTFAERQATLMDMASKRLGTDDQMFEDMKDYIMGCKDFIDELVTNMEESAGVVEGLHAFVEGDRGIYELDTMPVAPLLRRDDGSTMKQYVYGPTLRSGTMNPNSSQISTEAPPPVQTPIVNPAPSIVNPFQAAQFGEGSSNAYVVTNLMENGDPKYDTFADKELKKALKATRFGPKMTSKTVFDNLNNYDMKIENTETNMYEVLKTIVSQRMMTNSGVNISEDEMAALIDCINPGTEEQLSEYEEVFANAVANQSELEDFYSMMMAEEGVGEEQDEDGETTGNETEEE
jgi:hypothetical protein